MAKSANKAVKVEGTSIDALVKEGKALGKMWNAIHNVKQTTKANGFDTRLGKLLSTLKAQSAHDSGQIPTHVLRTHGIDKIDRRRRSEALWFYENQAECVEFIKASKKGFTSLTALQRAMKQAAKAEATQEPAKAEVSNVGQNDTTVSDSGWKEPKNTASTEQRSVNVMITRTKMVDTILHHCKQNNLNIEDIIADLQQHLGKTQKPTPTKAKAKTKRKVKAKLSDAEKNVVLRKSIG